MSVIVAPVGSNDCPVRPHRNGTIDGIGLRHINGRVYAECGHPIGERGWCGSLIDITDGPGLTPHICCGEEHPNYSPSGR